MNRAYNEQEVCLINGHLINFIVPKDAESIELLNVRNFLDGNYISYTVTPDIYDRLLKMGMFNELNERLGIIIDITEDEEILDVEKLKIAKEIVLKYIENSEVDILWHLSIVVILIEKAILYKTGIFFFF